MSHSSHPRVCSISQSLYASLILGSSCVLFPSSRKLLHPFYHHHPTRKSLFSLNITSSRKVFLNPKLDQISSVTPHSKLGNKAPGIAQVHTVYYRRGPSPAGRPLLLDYAAAAAAKSLQSCPTLCNPIDASPPGPAVPGILQARTLEWVAISSSNA